MNAVLYQALSKEVDRLLRANFIRKMHYSEWFANPILVKKKISKWRVCINFINLNYACPNDNFLLPKIDQIVDVTVGHELLSFIDVYSGYNQIKMHPSDENKTTLITN